MWNVLHRIRPDYVKNLINHAIQQRGLAVEEDDAHKVTLSIQQKWLDKLKESQILPGKQSY